MGILFLPSILGMVWIGDCANDGNFERGEVERMIVLGFTADGGFVAGDTVTKRTSYAYPTSIHATTAKRHPIETAREMMAQANGDQLYNSKVCVEYHERNWQALGERWGR